MEKLSVKKPFTVLVAVIMILVLGGVSVTRMITDLLPPMNLPYLMVITTYPGASPEQVEQEVVRPMEGKLGTVTGVKNVYSTAGENFGMVQLEFEDGTDMDSTMVKVSTAVQQASAKFPEICGTPSIIEMSMDMIATMYVAVSRENYDVYQLSAFVKDAVQPILERQDGVASVSPMGLVEQNIHVELDQHKIDDLNNRILESVSEKLAEAKKELDTAQQKVKVGKAELEKAQAAFGKLMADSVFSKVSPMVQAAARQMKRQVDELYTEIKKLHDFIADGETGDALDVLVHELGIVSEKLNREDLSLQNLLELTGSLRKIGESLQILLDNMGMDSENATPSENLLEVQHSIRKVMRALAKLSEFLDSVPQLLEKLEDAFAALTQAQLDAAVKFATANMELSGAEAQLNTAQKEYEASKAEALKNANLDQLLNIKTLAQLVAAQNFSMPAGYIDDINDNSWLLKVGNEFGSVEDLSGTLLLRMDSIGDIRLEDVSVITVIDNAGSSYAKLNGKASVVVGIFKNSTTGTNETSKNCQKAFNEIEKKFDGTDLVVLMNQGSYIDLIIDSILKSMVFGALLAIIILALFLKDVKPTLVVGISIPLSVMFALVLMYFTDISLNMMTLSGLALGIGMLVDNSIVVIENVYRLRSRGISAARAAVQGAKQVSGAIIASTLTTICVFLPLVFTEGMIRELMMPMGMCIGYCLMASLVVALTVVPASASTLLQKSRSKPHPLFEKFLNAYESILNWCLDHKLVPLTAAIALLVFCIVTIMNMGIVLLGDMTGNQIQVNVTTPDGITKEESYAMADDITETLLKIQGVDHVGAIDTGAGMKMMAGGLGPNGTFGKYTYFIALPDDTPASEVREITEAIEKATEDSPCKVTASSNSMGDMTAIFGKGLSLKVFGDDLEVLKDLSEEIITVVEQVPGYTGIHTAFEDGDRTIHLRIDKDKAMEYGLTVAQIYLAITEKMNSSANATDITINGVGMDVVIQNSSHQLTYENLMDMELETTQMDEMGKPVKQIHKLSEFATKEITDSIGSINRENQNRYVVVSASVRDGYNATLLSRQLSDKLAEYQKSNPLPYGYQLDMGGESETVNEMVKQMLLLIFLGFLFIYLVMVAQFQSLLSPFIVLFTIPLAFTGGLLGLLLTGQQLSMLSLMGFAVLMGTVVNNGIVFVDYVNQLRIGGLDRRAALIATGRTRMRPILMTALTTILAMMQLIFSDDMAGEMGRGMGTVIVGGMIYATLMTLIIVPVIYDLLFRHKPRVVDIGSDNLDDIPDDAAEYLEAAESSSL